MHCVDHSDFPAHSVFTSDVCWGSLDASIFGNSISIANNTQSRLPSRLSLRFLRLCTVAVKIIILVVGSLSAKPKQFGNRLKETGITAEIGQV